VARVVRAIAVLLCVALAACREAPLADEADALVSLMTLPEGATVADIGAGTGAFTVELSRRVGPGIRVVATELGQRNLRQLWMRAQKAGAGNVSLAEGAVSDTNLPAGSCDAVVLRRTYHHLMRPTDMAASLYRTLRPGGRLFVVEQPLVPLKPVLGDVPAERGGDGIEADVLIAELSAAGFRHDRTVDPFSRGLYLVVMGKPGGPGGTD
jgi:SAM-dependent methyltransferase